VTTGGVMVWAVYAPTNRRRGALSGTYAGAAAEATLIAGLGANALVGGSDRTIALQPFSVQGQVGLNIAAGGRGPRSQLRALIPIRPSASVTARPQVGRFVVQRRFMPDHALTRPEPCSYPRENNRLGRV